LFGDRDRFPIPRVPSPGLVAGPSHESGNIIIQVPGQRLVVMIDIALPGVASFQTFGNADSIPGVIRRTRSC
jgi:hypothetical protein